MKSAHDRLKALEAEVADLKKELTIAKLQIQILQKPVPPSIFDKVPGNYPRPYPGTDRYFLANQPAVAGIPIAVKPTPVDAGLYGAGATARPANDLEAKADQWPKPMSEHFEAMETEALRLNKLRARSDTLHWKA